MASPGGTSRVTSPATGPGPPATVRPSPAGASVPPGGFSVTWSGDRCTATGRFPAGAGPLPCSQYRVKTGWTGSGGVAVDPGGVAPGAAVAGPGSAGAGPAGASIRVTVPAAGTCTTAPSGVAGSGGPLVSSSRLVS